MQRAVFLDKDGTLLVDVPYNVDPGQMVFAPGAAHAVREFHRAGYLLVVISNQSGVARGIFPESALRGVEERLEAMMAEAGGLLGGFYYCPHYPKGIVAEYALECDCRKPRPGLILKAAAELDIDLDRSWFVGDILNDVEAGRRAGCRTILVDNGNETEWNIDDLRMPHHIASDMAEAAQLITCTLPFPRFRWFGLFERGDRQKGSR